MTEINPSASSITINLESKDYRPEDSEWQAECHQLYMRIKNALDEGTVEPLKVEKGEKGDRGDALIVFSTITTLVSSFTGLKALIDTVMPWLESRKNAEIILKFPDGSEMKVSKASKVDITDLYEKHLARQGK